MIVIEFGLFSSKTSITVHLNMSEQKNGELPLKAPTGATGHRVRHLLNLRRLWQNCEVVAIFTTSLSAVRMVR